MPLKAGTLSKGSQASDYTLGMAKAMEDAFRKEWAYAMKGSELPPTSDEMRLMFVAIAQGVVSHLKANAGAFKVAVTVSGVHTGTHSASAKTTIE